METINIKNSLDVTKQSKIGALIHVQDYEGFVKLIEEAENKADTFAEIEKVIAQKLEAGKDIKAVVDAHMKPLKKAHEALRGYLTQYMKANELERIDGTEIKSITFTDDKEQEGIVSKEQIMIKRKYVDIDALSKEDLVELLKSMGVKTKIVNEKVKTVKPAHIRVNK